MSVTQGKIKERFSDIGFKIYVLLLDDGFYYIGVSEYPEKRFSTHQKQGKSASSFCKKHLPLKIIEVINTNLLSLDASCDLEDFVTYHYIKIYGSKKVRGGRFLGSDRKVLKKYINYSRNVIFPIKWIPPSAPKGEQTLLR